MTRSADFGTTVRCGVRAAQPDLVVHARREPSAGGPPLVGFVVSKAVGSSVQRHRVARRLRHAARGVLAELDPADRVVIRALPGIGEAPSGRLAEQIAVGVRRTRGLLGPAGRRSR